jgi:SHAQKYF class myb-like DNA-binding protein
VSEPATSTDSSISDAAPAAIPPGPITTTPVHGRKYERRTKRFIWPDDLHRLFVAAVFDLGLKNASPKALLTLMGHPAVSSGLTTEHLKSHLQKYRLNYDRSRVEFMKFFDESVQESTRNHKRKGSHSHHKNVHGGSGAAPITSLFPIIVPPSTSSLSSSVAHANKKKRKCLEGRP